MAPITLDHIVKRYPDGQLAVDDQQQGTRPAVLVCHEGPGLDDHAK